MKCMQCHSQQEALAWAGLDTASVYSQNDKTLVCTLSGSVADRLGRGSVLVSRTLESYAGNAIHCVYLNCTYDTARRKIRALT